MADIFKIGVSLYSTINCLSNLAIKYFIVEVMLQRSKKYSTYSDDQLIKLFGKDNLKGDSKHFLIVELRYRELLEKAEQQKPLTKKLKPKSKKMILAGVVLAALLLMRVLQRMF